MEYMTMLEEPGLVLGLQELIHDTDTSVVKRTIRVFTNVYRHSLSLVATGDLDPVKYEACYAEINMVSNELIDMLKTAENEGIVVHLVRYLEAGLVSHILSDLSKHPHIAEMTAPMLKKGVKALLDLVDTPYVGGTAFCVAIRALITVACYQVDMRPKITDVCEVLINAPPPNLFDHNVRSFHKTLQRNLFRLLKREENNAEKERLIDLMVRVGVPRKRLSEWGPRASKKRTASRARDDGKDLLPVTKRVKVTEEQIIRLSPPPGNRSKIFSPLSSQKSPITMKSNTEDPQPTSISSILDQILSGDKMTDFNWLPPVKKTERKSIESILKEKSAASANRGRISPSNKVSDPLSTIIGILKLPDPSRISSRVPLSGRISPEQKSEESSYKRSSGRNSPQESKPGSSSLKHSPSGHHSPEHVDDLCRPAPLATLGDSDLKTMSPRSDTISQSQSSGHNSPIHSSGRKSLNDHLGHNSPKLPSLMNGESAKATISFAPISGTVFGVGQSLSDAQVSIRNIIRLQGFSSKEAFIYEKLSTETVVEMLLNSTKDVPAETPKYIPRISLEPLDVMKEKLAILLAMYVPNSVMSNPSLSKAAEVRKTVESSVSSQSSTVASSERWSSKISSKETSSLFFSKDFDLRQRMPASSDIDTRNLPLSSDSRKSNPSFTSQQEDSDLGKQNELEQGSLKPVNRDPRLSPQFAATVSSDPRLSSRCLYNNHAVSSSDPRLKKLSQVQESSYTSQPPPSVPAHSQPSSRDPRLSARRSPPVGNPAVSSYGPTVGTVAMPSYRPTTVLYPAPPMVSYGVSSAAPTRPTTRDPRLKVNPTGSPVNPMLSPYPFSQPLPDVYPNHYPGLPNINNAYRGRLY